MSDLEPVVIELNDGNSNTDINLSSEVSLGKQPSVNFGGGIELLMNDKKRSGSSADVGLAELSELENELNDLTTDISNKGSEISRSNIFNSAINSVSISKENNNQNLENINKNNLGAATANLGEQTASNFNVNKTWDGD
mgnify:FL=1